MSGSEGLAPEDLLRLNVLLAQDVKAVRIDESNLTLHALTDKGEASVPLHPNCREDRYLRLVREFLSGHALGSPGGYPVYLTRWTRQGQLASPNLGRLLLTGEPEAVTAVVHAPGLSDELAQYAWWAQPSIENARLMLSREAVACGKMGKVLADFLLEHLAFLQNDHAAIMDTVAVLLASGAVDAAGREAIWRRGKRTNSYYVAFLEAGCDLPCPLGEWPGLADWRGSLEELAVQGNVCADRLLMAFSPQGQTFLEACAEILTRPETQDVVNRTLNALGRRFRPASGGTEELATAASALAVRLPGLRAQAHAVAALAEVSDRLTEPIFARSTAIGSLMRRKIEPVIQPILAEIRLLRGEPPVA